MVAPKEAALMAKARLYEPRATTAAASAGPTTRPKFHCAELSETAPSRSSAGTSSGRREATNGMLVAVTQPATSTTAVTRPGDAWPVAVRTASKVARAASMRLAATRNRRRSRRSASAPPTGDSTPVGRKAAAATSAAHRLLPVTTATREPTATICIHVPTLETRLAENSRA